MTEARSNVLVDVFYGDGWDSLSRSTVRPISREEAARRDAAGQPYAVVLIAAGQEVPLGVLHVAWAQHYLGLWRFDSMGRSVFEADLRRLEPGRLFLRHMSEWRYDREDLADRSDEAWRRTIDLYPDGTDSQSLYPRGRLGGSTQTLVKLPPDQWWLPFPEFGCWDRLLSASPFGLQGAVELTEATSDVALPSAIVEAEPFGWRPPTPAAAPWPEQLFTSGHRFARHRRAEPVIIEPVRTVTDISLPTGQLVVCDPSYLAHGHERDPLLIDVPPGVYPVQSTGASYEDEMFGDRFTVQCTYAVRLLISQQQTVSWSMAIPPGNDARLLRDGHYVGFRVDSATGCFVDTTVRRELGRRLMEAITSNDGESEPGIADGYSKVTDHETDAHLVTFMLDGDGLFPVWIGRDDTGEMTAVVVVTDGYEVGQMEPWGQR